MVHTLCNKCIVMCFLYS